MPALPPWLLYHTPGSSCAQLGLFDWAAHVHKAPCREAACGADMLPPAGPPWNVQAYDASTGKVFSGPDTAGQYNKDKWEGPTEDPFGFRQKARVLTSGAS